VSRLASTPSPSPGKRPKCVTLFALAVLYLGVVNLARGWLASFGLRFERTLPLTLPLPYLAAGGLTWGIAFAMIAFGLWRLWPWARSLALGAIILYQGHIWINHLLFDVSTYSRQVWLFQSGVSAVWIAVVWGFLALPGIRQLYRSR
jgi:hypothetical protein